MLKKNIYSIIFLSIIIITIAAYFVYPKLAKTDADPWVMIPENASLILQYDKPTDFMQKLTDDNSLWNSASKSGEFKKIEFQLLKLAEVLSEESSYLELLNNSPLLISYHTDKETNTIARLILSQIKIRPGIDDLKARLARYLGSKFAVVDINERSLGGIKIIDALNESTFYIVFIDGVMLASANLNLLTKSVLLYKSGKGNFSANDDFIAVKKTAGKNVDLRVYINYENITNLLKLFSSSPNYDALDWFSQFASWTELDIIIKDDEILMTGYTSFGNDSTYYLNKISNQKPQKTQIYNVCPFNTDILLRLGYDDFYSQFISTNNIVEGSYSVPGLNYNMSKLLLLIGKEAVIGNSANQLAEFKEKAFAIIHFKDRQRAESILFDIAKVSKGKRTTKFNGHSINQINSENFLSSLFGSTFNSVKNNYYLFIGDYAVFANSQDMLISILQMYDTGKTLDLNDNFKKYSDNLSSTENVSLFIKPRDIIYLLPLFIENETNKLLFANKEVIKDVQGISFQYSIDGPLAYTNFYLKLGKTYSEENLALWKIQMNDEIVGKPYLVRDHSTNKYMVLVFDKSSNLYLVDTDGQLLWKKRIDGLPQGEIHQVDYFKNGKIQYLFNTRDFIYLIDKNGNFVKNYPKKLNPAATNGLNLFDYNRKKDYRLILAQADKKVYNYNINGSKVKGWKEPHTQNIVNEPVKRVVANNKDYILITDIDNKTMIVNRKGNERIKIKGDLKKARNSGYFVNRTNSKGIILTTNQFGKLTYIKSNGKLAETDFGTFSKDHFFLYEDFNDDNSVDFIFVDGRKLRVFDRFKKELFSYNFEYEINIQPMFFSLGRKKSVLGVVSDQEKTIFLFDSKGNTIISRGLVGETPFTVGSLNNNRELNLITASGSILYNYRLK